MSRSFDGVDDVLTVTHGAGLDIHATYTIAFWAKRTGAGEGDYRICGKATGSAAGSLQVTGQSGDVTQLRARQITTSTADFSITATGALTASTWLAFCVTFDGTNAQKIYKWNGSAFVELSYASQNDDPATPVGNTVDFYIGNSSDTTLSYQGLLAFLAVASGVWTQTEMDDYGAGTLPTGTDFFWRMDEDLATIPNSGDVAGFGAAVTGATFSTDNPTPTYSSGTSANAEAATGTGAANDATVTAVPGQSVGPATDITTAGWTATGGTGSLASAIDETPADDGDFVTSPANPSASVFETKFEAATDPGVSTGHSFDYRLRVLNAGSYSVTAALYQGTTLIASETRTTGLTSSFQTFSLTLSGGEADAITDYADLRLRVTATAAA